jgi:hypothetical protein
LSFSFSSVSWSSPINLLSGVASGLPLVRSFGGKMVLFIGHFSVSESFAHRADQLQGVNHLVISSLRREERLGLCLPP